MTLSTLRDSAAEREEKKQLFDNYIKLIEKARAAVEEADLFAWGNFDDYFDITANETSPYSLSFIISELGAIGVYLKKMREGGDAG